MLDEVVAASREREDVYIANAEHDIKGMGMLYSYRYRIRSLS